MPGSAIDGLTVFEGEGQAAICVGRGVVQQPAPELLTECGTLSCLWRNVEYSRQMIPGTQDLAQNCWINFRVFFMIFPRF